MPAIADQVATIEHDLSVALANLDSVRSENAQLKTALSSLQNDHAALQARHSEAVALFDETRQHAQAVATAALTMLKVSRPQAGPTSASEGTTALLKVRVAPLTIEPSTVETNAQGGVTGVVLQSVTDAVTAALEPEKTDVRPELPVIDQGQQDTAGAEPVSGDSGDEHQVASTECTTCGVFGGHSAGCPEEGFPPELQDALHADAEKLSQLTGQPHTVTFIHEGAVLGGADDAPNVDRLRAHMSTAEPLPIFLKQGQQTTGVLG
ncbi:hypothetical protein [Bradyrhizobium sp.]|jgi:hypothetical protein|uniref:hypothetical protein n=1 Tax=Bradyrhizobium sp. TaxID=376 RepID=UPI002DDD19F3|nr:hypothetical protein [Bradyrhizobium sp.]HEV2155437.1 hypothetical protein [Bradyrhizobium sp.]